MGLTLMCLVLAVGGLGGVGRSPGLPVAAVAAPAAGNVIVVLTDDADPSAVASRAQVVPTRIYRTVFRGFAAHVSATAMRGLVRNPHVVLVSADQPVQTAAQTLPTGVDRVEADRHPVAAIDGVDRRVDADVAVLDTGIDPTHPDLNVAGGVDCTGDGAGDRHGHGTHVAGTIGALDNGMGVVGVAPGVRLWAVKVLDDAGAGSDSTVICGLDWVAAHASTVDVANMSLTGAGSDGACTSSAYHRAVCAVVSAGVPIVAAAGNAGVDAATTVPATYDEVIAVSAYTDFNGRPGGGAPATCSSGGTDDAFAHYSNFGADVDIAAPGTCIRATVPGGGIGFRTGTSMAAAHAAGAIALYRAVNPGASPMAVRMWLVRDAPAQDSAMGFTGGRSGEPVLVLATDTAIGGGATATPTATATRTPTQTATPVRTATVMATQPIGSTATVLARAPTVSLDKAKSKYNGWVTASLAGFLPNSTVTLNWPRAYAVTSGPNDGQFTTLLVQGTTDGSGAATLRFRTPLEPLGDYEVTASGTGGRTASDVLRVIPRIMLNEDAGPADTRLRVYFYGFGPSEVIEVRWHTTNSTSSAYVVIKRITVASNGRASTLVPIPGNAALGEHRIVGKVVGVSRSASTTFTLTAGVSAAEAATETPTSGRSMPTATATSGAIPTEAPTETAEPTTAGSTDSSTMDPTATATAVVTMVPESTASSIFPPTKVPSTPQPTQ